MEEYLAFVDEVGRSLDGGYIYRFDFTVDREAVWGEFFNVAPAAIIPNLQPDKNTISSTGNVIFPSKLITAKKNYCFSMQDCIDGIIPLVFSEISENTIECDGVPFFLNFADPISLVNEKLQAVGTKLYDIEKVEHGDGSAIDDLINSIGEDDIDF